MRITIMNTPCTASLPEIIEKCKGEVYLMLNDMQYPLKSSPGTLSIFKKLWKNSAGDEAELVVENIEDEKKLFGLTFNGGLPHKES